MARHVAYPPVQGVVHASSMAPLLTGLLATCHVCSTRSTLPSPATLFQTSHPTPITQFEASWRGQDRVYRQHDVPLCRHGVERWRVGLPAGPPADLCGWRSAGRWCVHHRPGCHPRHAQGGTPRARRTATRGGSHQRRDAVACRTSPLVDLGRRHCTCRG